MSYYKQKPLQKYHHYEGNECVAQFLMHEDRGGVWFTGPIVLVIDDKGRRSWDETKKDDLYISRQKTEAMAVNMIRRKLGQPPVGVGIGESWDDLDKNKRGTTLA